MSWYRILLRLLPRDTREHWGQEFEDLVQYRLHRATGRVGRVWVRFRAVWDLLGLVAQERITRNDTTTRTGGGGVKALVQDVRYAMLGLLSTRGVSLLAVLTLAIGIGASTMTYSVVDGVLLRDLPYGEPDQLVAVWPDANFNPAMVLEAEALDAFEAVSGAGVWTMTLSGDGDPQELNGTLVSPGHFDLLRAVPALGRSFREEEALPGRADVVVLGYDLWVSRFGADPDIVGQTIGLAGADYDRRTVIGVMSEQHRPVFAETDLWVPLEHDPALAVEDDYSWYVNYRVARLAPGVSLEQADQAVARFGSDIQDRLPRVFSEEDEAEAGVMPLATYKQEGFGPALLALMGAVGLVLLIACANVANLLLARGESRSHALAIRSALGAGRARVARMLLAEGALIGLAGGALGIGMAHLLLSSLLRYAPNGFPRVAEIALDGRVMAFALLASITVTLVAALSPALRISNSSRGLGMLTGNRGPSSRATSGLSRSLVGLEVALAVVVTIGSGLMLRSLDRLMSVDTGMQPRGVLTFRANPPSGRYPSGDAFFGYYNSLEDQLRGLPGVETIGAINLLPGTSGNWSFPTFPDGVEVADGAAIPSVNYRAVRPGYFETVGMSLLQGRDVRVSDHGDAENVVLVNQAFVDEFWPESDPMGRSVRIFSSTAEPARVIGVVGNVRQHGRAQTPRPEMYFSHAQAPWNQMAMWMMVRFSDGETTSHATNVQAAVWAVDGDVPITGLEGLDAVFGRSAQTTKFLALLLGGFGALSLLLGAIGVFGVTSHLVGRRTAEFGVRIALGSSRRQVLTSGIADTSLPIAIGIALGTVAALLASRVLESVLYEVDPADPATFAAVALVLSLTGAVAALIPAWRASRVDPITVLKSD